jgi:hypothetical protein
MSDEEVKDSKEQVSSLLENYKKSRVGIARPSDKDYSRLSDLRKKADL